MQMTRQSLSDRQIALIEHYLGQLEDLSQMFAQGRDWAQEALRRFDQEWQQLHTQQQWAVGMATRNTQAAKLVVSFPQRANALLMQVDSQEAVRWVEEALAWVEAEDVQTRYHLLQMSHEIQKQRLDVERIRDIVDDLEGLAQRLDDDHARAEAAYMKAEYFDTIDDYDNQLIWSEHALTLALHVEDQILIANAYHQLGFAYTRVEQYIQAETHLNTALTLFQQLGMTLQVGNVHSAMALNAYSWNKFEEALMYGEQALVAMRDSGQRQRELTVLSNLALLAQGAGNLEKALMYGQQAWRTALDLGSRTSEQTALAGLITILGELGLEDELMTYVDRTRKHLSDIPSRHLQSLLTYTLARFAYERGDWATACQSAAQQALIDNSGQDDDNENEHDSTFIWGSSLIELGMFDEAAAAFSRCLELKLKQVENAIASATARAGLSYADSQRGHKVDAQTHLDAFFALLADDDIANVYQGFIALWHASRACKALNDPRLAFLMDQFDTLLQRYLTHLHDEWLRASFLSSISIQRLLAARAHT